MFDAVTIESAIREESEKLIERYNVYHNALHSEWVRNKKRIINAPEKVVLKPDYWMADRKFDPFYCNKKSRSIARSIAAKIRAGTYKPHVPHDKLIPKSSGGQRRLRIYQIPDAAISRLLYRRLLAKNKHRFSSFSYAYRDDRNVHFAIQDIAADLGVRDRAFVAEFDFSDFFGNIDHDFLMSQLKSHGLLLSEQDFVLIRLFLNDKKGIPQGTSISLFLANVACFALDRRLEELGVKFARYADDTVICTPSYELACKAVQVLFDFSRNSGVPINQNKSAGIHLLTHAGFPAEIRAKSSFDFLGYAIGNERIGVKSASLQKVKKQISYLLYRNLIQPLRPSKLRAVSIPSSRKDEALLTAMMQVRRYICGGLYKRQLENYANGGGGQLRFKGAMSFYPLVNDIEQLKNLDGWLVATIHRALRLRAVLLARHGFTRFSSFPFSVDHSSLVRTFDRYRVHAKPLLEIPSFVLVQAAMRRALKEHGIHYVMNPRSDPYSY